MVNGGGPGHPVRLIVSEEINRAIHFDPEMAVVYLKKRLYAERASFLLSALFLIPNLQFRIQWGEQSRGAAQQTLGDDPETTEGGKGDRSSGPKDLERFLQETGLSLSILSLKMRGITDWPRTSGGHFVIEPDMMRVSHRGKVILDRDNIYSVRLIKMPDFEVDVRGGKWGVIDRNRREILPFEYESIDVYSHGGDSVFVVSKDGKRGVIGGNGTWIFPLDVADFRILKGEEFSIARLSKSEKKLEILPYSVILTIARNPNLRGRLEEIRRHRLPIGPTSLFTIIDASQEVWDRFLQEEGLRPHLHRLSNPLVVRYADSHRDQTAPLLIRGLKLIEHYNSFARSDNEAEFFHKIDQILRSRIDLEKLFRALGAGRTSRDIEAVQLYLSRPGPPLLQGEVKIPPLRSTPLRLADAITKIRLSQRQGLDLLKKVPNFRNEQDERDLSHAIHHLNISNPYAFVRELLQNSLDEKSGGISIETYESQGRLLVSFRDEGGMTEEQLIGLLDPGEGTKRGREFLGGFGVGFYSSLAEANWVRLKTAVKGSDQILLAEFLVDRDESGKIADIRLRVQKRKNDGFFGTQIETERYAGLPQIEAARLDATVKDLTRYIDSRKATIEYNGAAMNRARPDPLVVHEGGPLGRIELHDGLENRILLGGLPLTDLPQDLWEEVPAGIRKFFSRLGFYLNLDPRVVKTTPTRDRFREPERVLPELKKTLPGLLVRGFLERVSHSQEDIHRLPEVYFIEAYELASIRVLGEEILQDAEKINEGRYGEIDYEKYARGEEGERRLLKLLTVVRFIPFAGDLLSLRQVYEMYQKETLPDELPGMLPSSLRSRLERAEGSRDYEASARDDLSGRTDLEPERLYERGEIEDRPTRLYLSLLHEVISALYRHHRREGQVTVGVHTLKKRIGAYAYHFSEWADYSLYRSFGPSLERDVQELSEILAGADPVLARRNFDSYLARMFETVSHELTHVLTERPDTPDFTHDPLFYQNQMEILTGPDLPRDIGETLLGRL